MRLAANNPARVEFDDVDGSVVRLPVLTPIEREHVPGWRREFQAMRDALRGPTPSGRLRCELGVLSVIKHVVEHQADAQADGPAQRLKRLIDDDQGCSRSLEELSEHVGYTHDHLRILFEREYGTPPRVYRTRRRVAQAMDLISSTSLSIKQIAIRLGFSHTPAFCAMFKRETGITPGEAVSRRRHV